MTKEIEINWIRPNNNSDSEAIIKGKKHAYHVVIESSECMPPYCFTWTVQTENSIYKHGNSDTSYFARMDALRCVEEIEQEEELKCKQK
jgi:hypothetical protein